MAMRQFWRLRVALLAAAALCYGRAGSRGGLPELAMADVCQDDRGMQTDTVCLRLYFIRPLGGRSHWLDVPVTCAEFDAPFNRTPNEVDFWDKGKPLHWCRNMSEANPHCTYEMPSPPQGSKGVTFCAQMQPLVSVVPRCVQEGACGLKVPAGKTQRRLEFGFEDLNCAFLLMMYILCGYIAQRLQYVHETQLAVIVGLAVGYTSRLWLGITINFNNDTFTWFVLPMVIFGTGFNLEKERFFKYTHYVLTLGVIGTVFTSALIFWASSFFKFSTADGTAVSLPTSERALMAAVMASADSVAPVAFLSAEAFPMLSAVVLGESIMNSVASLLLVTVASNSQTLLSLIEQLQWILRLVASSGMAGMFFGLGLSLLFRRMTKLHQGIIQPVAMLFIGNYMCYIVAALAECSSIMALFVCAVVCGHYTKHSLSPDAQDFSEELAEYLCYSAEAFVFGYFGLTASTNVGDPTQFSLCLILYYSAVILISRFLVAGLLSLLVACFLDSGTKPLNAPEMLVVTFAGCMRGTMAYALVIAPMPGPEKRSALDKLLVNTVLGIVLLNCLVFGSLFSVVLKFARLQPTDELDGVILDSSTELQMEPHAMLNAWNYFDARFLQPVLVSQPTARDDACPRRNSAPLVSGAGSDSCPWRSSAPPVSGATGSVSQHSLEQSSDIDFVMRQKSLPPLNSQW